MCDGTDRVKKTMEPCSTKPEWFNCLGNSLIKNNIMSQNKLKLKVEALTRVVQQLISEVQQNGSLAKGTLTAFQLHIGEEKWKELVIDMQAIEGSKKEPVEKKFEDVE